MPGGAHAGRVSAAPPPAGFVLAMLAVLWLAASALLFPLALLAYAGLARWLGEGARRAAWGVAAAALLGAFAWMTVGRTLPVPWAMAYGEEVAFGHLAAGTAMLLAVAWRRAGRPAGTLA